MQGKTVVITGATSGIGEVAALSLAQQGARIVLIARDRARGEQTLKRLEAVAPGRNHLVHYANLSRLAEMKRVAEAIAASEPRIDVLINNAGALFTTRQVTGDALEMTFATNHIAYFVVTNLLLDRLKATAGARIVSTSSDAHRRAKLDFNDLHARACAAFDGYRRDGELLSSRFRGYTIWRCQWRVARCWPEAREKVCFVAGRRCEDPHLSSVSSGGRECHRSVLPQMQASDANRGSSE
jgi:NAD(P)-dependent dehydrogenase (short-subunit alcohol dehydrogenase family)